MNYKKYDIGIKFIKEEIVINDKNILSSDIKKYDITFYPYQFEVRCHPQDENICFKIKEDNNFIKNIELFYYTNSEISKQYNNLDIKNINLKEILKNYIVQDRFITLDQTQDSNITFLTQYLNFETNDISKSYMDCAVNELNGISGYDTMEKEYLEVEVDKKCSFLKNMTAEDILQSYDFQEKIDITIMIKQLFVVIDYYDKDFNIIKTKKTKLNGEFTLQTKL